MYNSFQVDVEAEIINANLHISRHIFFGLRQMLTLINAFIGSPICD
jgi:hypothetical protein